MKDEKRRLFIIDSVKTTVAIVVSATLGNELLLPQTVKAANAQFPESICGDKNKTGKKILVTYASRYGTTGEVAEAIGKVLCQTGNTVETKWVKNVKDLYGYDSVIIGSAIQYDRWMSEATEFVKSNQNILNKLPVAYFFTCLVLAQQTKKTEKRAMAYSDSLYSLVPQVKPLSVGRFAGVLDYSKMSFFHRLIVKPIMAIVGVKEGDYRDWDSICLWARGLHLKISGEQA